METDAHTAGNSLPFLRVCGLTKHYVRRSGILRGRVPVAAVQDVDFEIPPGKTLALVGSSGSGKSTVARCVTRLEKPDAGQIWMGGTDISWLGNRDLRPYRSEIQMIFQDAVTSMNPRLSAAQVIEEPLLIQGRGSKEDRRSRAQEMMREVGLSPNSGDRSVMEFSGGSDKDWPSRGRSRCSQNCWCWTKRFRASTSLQRRKLPTCCLTFKQRIRSPISSSPMTWRLWRTWRMQLRSYRQGELWSRVRQRR